MEYISEATLAPIVQVVNSVLEILYYIPGMTWLVHYFLDSLHADPWRLFLEFVLIVIGIRYLFTKGYRPKNRNKLTKKEVEELISEWEPEPLIPPTTTEMEWELDKIPLIEGKFGTELVVKGKNLANFVAFDFLGLLNNKEAEAKALQVLRSNGVGSCGPPGFYGTVDIHMSVEKEFAAFMKTPSAILYSYGFATIASAIPAFARKGDFLVVDEGVSFATQKGFTGSRANTILFKHNDLADLERILKEITDKERKKKIPLVRKFIVVEGLYTNTGDICPLREIVELKEKYKFRLMMEESNSFGVLGKTGRGITEHSNVPISKVDLITFGLANSTGAAGGLCIGSLEITDRQRLSGVGYCFSASMPPLLAAAALVGLDAMIANPKLFENLAGNIAFFRQGIQKQLPAFVELVGHPDSPIMHFRLTQRLSTRFEEKKYLQSVVDSAMDNGIFFGVAKYVEDQETRLPAPSIRVNISAGHSKDVLADASKALADSFRSNPPPYVVA